MMPCHGAARQGHQRSVRSLQRSVWGLLAHEHSLGGARIRPSAVLRFAYIVRRAVAVSGPRWLDLERLACVVQKGEGSRPDGDALVRRARGRCQSFAGLAERRPRRMWYVVCG